MVSSTHQTRVWLSRRCWPTLCMQVEDALKFGGIEFAAKFVSYFCYERLWIWLPKVL